MKRLIFNLIVVLLAFAAMPSIGWAATWYTDSVKYTAVAQWAATHTYTLGAIVRQLAAPAVGSERCFKLTTLGTGVSGAVEPTWVLTAGATTTESGVGLVWTEITGQSSFGWTAPHARIANACASGWMAAGDTDYVGNQHAETQSTAMTITSPGTAAAPCNFVCVSNASSPPTAATTGATVSTTGAATITIVGFGSFYGITFNAGSGASSSGINLLTGATAGALEFESCSLNLTATSGNSIFSFGVASLHGEQISLKNTILGFTSANNTISTVGCRVLWFGGSTTGSASTTLFGTFARSGYMYCHGVDLSSFGSGKNIVNLSNDAYVNLILENCKLNASVSITTGSNVGQGCIQVEMVNCDPSLNYRYLRSWYQGTIAQEATVVRSGGATDGTTPISRKMVSSAGANFASPLESAPVEYWNNTTGSPITITVPVITDNVTLTNAQAWIEVEYLGTANTPQSSIGTCRAADIVTTPANQPTDSTSTWTTTGLTTPVKQSLSVTITPQVKGWIKARVEEADPSTTMWYDPEILTTAGGTYMAGQEGQINAAASGGPVAPINSRGNFAN